MSSASMAKPAANHQAEGPEDDRDIGNCVPRGPLDISRRGFGYVLVRGETLKQHGVAQVLFVCLELLHGLSVSRVFA